MTRRASAQIPLRWEAFSDKKCSLRPRPTLRFTQFSLRISRRNIKKCSPPASPVSAADAPSVPKSLFLPRAGKIFLARFLFLAALVITRWPLSPHHLFGFDNVNFALALSKFDPLASQPQAPGYPLFVLVSRLVHFAVPSEVQTGLVMGFLGSAAALFFIERLGSELFGPPAGWIAAGL